MEGLLPQELLCSAGWGVGGFELDKTKKRIDSVVLVISGLLLGLWETPLLGS